jgi:hypothetical protein
MVYGQYSPHIALIRILTMIHFSSLNIFIPIYRPSFDGDEDEDVRLAGGRNSTVSDGCTFRTRLPEMAESHTRVDILASSVHLARPGRCRRAGTFTSPPTHY